jgi:hypothetical protein
VLENQALGLRFPQPSENFPQAFDSPPRRKHIGGFLFIIFRLAADDRPGRGVRGRRAAAWGAAVGARRNEALWAASARGADVKHGGGGAGLAEARRLRAREAAQRGGGTARAV